MKKTIPVSLSDIRLINRVIFPSSKLMVVFADPKESPATPGKDVVFIQDKEELNHFLDGIKIPFTIINYANDFVIDPTRYSLFEGILNFSKKHKPDSTSYLFINNPDGSIRWFFPENNQTACYLNLYNGSGWKANLFVKASKILSKVNGLSLVSNGKFSIYRKNNGTISANFPKVSFDDFAVFTGTIGENRKAIVCLSSSGLATQFIKIPLTSTAATLVKNEFQQLSKLHEADYKTTILPAASYKQSQIMVSNILPKEKSKNQDWSAIHWKSLAELYQNSYQKKPLIATPFWETIVEGIKFLQRPFSIKNGLKYQDITTLKSFVEQAFHRIDPTLSTALGIGHGDFTPWNMYVGNDQLHIYDWEMSQSDFPLLFDVFHYFFQKGILIKRDNYCTIKKDIDAQFQSKEAHNLMSKFKLNQDKHFQLYLLYIVCYYLPKYISQPKLHDQVHWLIATWIEGFENIHPKTKSVLSHSR